MPTDTNLIKIKALGEVIQKNLAVVQQALGIEAIDDSDLSEFETESEIVAKDPISILPKKELTLLELAEEKVHLSATWDANQVRFLASQVMFAESVAKFNSLKEKFARRKAKNQ